MRGNFLAHPKIRGGAASAITAGGITAAIVDEEAGDGYACAHGITAKANVVIDISACSYGMADQGVSVASTIINAIAGKFPT
jgi:hypothetical protein